MTEFSETPPIKDQKTNPKNIRKKLINIAGSAALASAAAAAAVFGIKGSFNKNHTNSGEKPGPSADRFLNQTTENPNIGDAVSISPDEYGIFIEINKIRAEAGLIPVLLDDKLTILSRERSNDMAKNQYFSHFDKKNKPYFSTMMDAVCENPQEMAKGENLAENNYPNPVQQSMDAWMKSESHRKNILNPNWKAIGIGEAKDSKGITIFTTLFSDIPCETPHVFRKDQ